jgi:hypothetical protein
MKNFPSRSDVLVTDMTIREHLFIQLTAVQLQKEGFIYSQTIEETVNGLVSRFDKHANDFDNINN